MHSDSLRITKGLEATHSPWVSTEPLRETHHRRARLSASVNLNNCISKGEVLHSRTSLVWVSVCKENQVQLFFWENFASHWPTVVHGHLEEELRKVGSSELMTLLSHVQKIYLCLTFQIPNWKFQCCYFEPHSKYHGTWSVRYHHCPGEQLAFFCDDFIQLVIEEMSQVSKWTQSLMVK